MAFLKEIAARTGNTFVLEDRSISGTDHHVVALQRFGATVTGETQMFEAVSIMRFDGGLQLERWFYLPEQDAFEITAKPSHRKKLCPVLPVEVFSPDPTHGPRSSRLWPRST
jgi:hypothetical protein